MSESILPVSPKQIAETDIQSQSSDTATEPPNSPDKCQLQLDAMRGAMADVKRAMKRMAICQEEFFRCRHGVSLYQTSGMNPEAYNMATLIRSAAGMMTLGLERLSERIGIRIDAE